MKLLRCFFNKKVGIWAGVFGQDEIAADYWIRAAELESTPSGMATSLITAANHLTIAKKLAESEAVLRRSIEIDGTQAPAWFNLGFLIQKRNAHEDALEAFDQAIRHDPRLDRAHYGRALSLMALDRNIEAKASLERTVDLQPMSPYGYYHLAHLQFRMGDEKAYRKTTRKLHTFEPKLAVQLQTETGVDAGVTDPFDRLR
jgi:tetratricopeptide (TPR) repeat protein